MMTSRRGYCFSCLVVQGRISRTPAGGNSELRSTSCSVEILERASHNYCKCVWLFLTPSSSLILTFPFQYVHNLMPRGQYTSGKGSSAVGLTAYITRDPETRQLVLQT